MDLQVRSWTAPATCSVGSTSDSARVLVQGLGSKVPNPRIDKTLVSPYSRAAVSTYHVAGSRCNSQPTSKEPKASTVKE